jgi:hypothetical protein
MVIGAVACVRLAGSAEVVVTLRGDKATRTKDLADVTGHESSGWITGCCHAMTRHFRVARSHEGRSGEPTQGLAILKKKWIEPTVLCCCGIAQDDEDNGFREW